MDPELQAAGAPLPLPVAPALIEMGNICVHSGKIDEARTWYKHVIDRPKGLPNPRNVRIASSNLATLELHLASGSHEEKAKRSYSAAITSLITSPD